MCEYACVRVYVSICAHDCLLACLIVSVRLKEEVRFDLFEFCVLAGVT